VSVAAAAPTGLLSVQGVRIEAGSRILVENLSFRVACGEIWCVLGPNGSGKSTLLHVLAGLREPRRGSVSLQGRPYRSMRLREAASLRALLLQSQVDAFESSVLETVMLGRHPYGSVFGRASAEDHAQAEHAMRCMGIAPLAARDVRTLSGGERQRVALASTLAQDPRLYLLDEPTAHLDLAHQAALFHALGALTRTGRGVIFATHEYNLAARFATHALLLSGTGAVLTGRAHEMLDAARLSTLFGFPLAHLSAPGASAFSPLW